MGLHMVFTNFCLFLAFIVIEYNTVLYELREKDMYGLLIIQFSLLSYSILCYFATHFIKPGYFMPDSGHPYVNKDRDDNGLIPHCSKCDTDRPFRCHHCSKCNKCVLFYDHHCDILDNCIGHRNSKSFFLFLLSFTLLMLISIINIIISIYLGHFKPMFITPGALCIIIHFIGYAFAGSQLNTQFRFIKENITFIEDSQLLFKKDIYARAGVPYVNRYYQGSIVKHIKQRFGSNVLLWVIPTPNDEINILFPVNKDYVPLYKVHKLLAERGKESLKAEKQD